MHISPNEERIVSLPFLDSSGRDSEGLGRCDTDSNITFRCPCCNYALTTCADCFSDEGSLSEEFYDKHFRSRKVDAAPDTKKGECPACRQTKKGGNGLVKMNTDKIPNVEEWDSILKGKGLNSNGKKDGEV